MKTNIKSEVAILSSILLICCLLSVSCGVKNPSIDNSTSKTGYKEIGKEYSKISDLRNINRKLVFLSRDASGEKVVIYGEKESQRYTNIESFDVINDKIAIIASDYLPTKSYENKNYVVYDDKKIGNQTSCVCCLQSIGDKLAFQTADKTRANSCDYNSIIYDGKKIGTKYDLVTCPFEINGTLAFIAKINGSSHIADIEGNRLSNDYENILYCPKVFNNSIFFIAHEDRKEFIVYNNKEGKKYDYILDPFIYPILFIKGKLVYYVKEKNDTFLVQGDREYRELKYDGSKKIQTDRVGSYKEINGELALLIYSPNGSYISFHGENFGIEYDHVFDFLEVNKSLVYRAFKEQNTYIVQNRTVIAEYPGYSPISSILYSIADVLTYGVEINGSQYVVHGLNIVPGEYDCVVGPYTWGLIDMDGKLAFIAGRDGKESCGDFIVIEK